MMRRKCIRRRRKHSLQRMGEKTICGFCSLCACVVCVCECVVCV
jgi:hypothetical protein